MLLLLLFKVAKSQRVERGGDTGREPFSGGSRVGKIQSCEGGIARDWAGAIDEDEQRPAREGRRHPGTEERVDVINKIRKK